MGELSVLIDTYSATIKHDSFPFPWPSQRLFEAEIAFFVEMFRLDCLGSVTQARALNGYSQAVTFEKNEGVTIHTSDSQENMGVFIYFSGQGLRKLKELREYEDKKEFHFHDLLEVAEEKGVRPSRVDIAIDTIECGVNLNDIHKRFTRGELCRYTPHGASGELRRVSSATSGYKVFTEGKEVQTIYFGSRERSILRIYDKRAEMLAKSYSSAIIPEDYKRFEGELRKEDAQFFQSRFRDFKQNGMRTPEETFGYLASFVLNKFNLSDTNKKGERVGECKEWLLIKSLISHSHFRFETLFGTEADLLRSIEHLKRQYLSVFQKVLGIYGEEGLTDFLVHLADETELRSRTEATTKFVDSYKELLLDKLEEEGEFPWR